MKNKLHQIKYFLKHVVKTHHKGHGVHSPFAFQLCEEVFYNKHPFYVFEQLANLRRELLKDDHMIHMEDFGAGSNTFKTNERRVRDICKYGISSKKQSEILYRLIHHMSCKCILELGTSVGLNTLYLASVHPNNQVMTIDASSELIAYAKNLAQQQKLENIRFICDRFDTALAPVLEQNKRIDFVYIDGNHDYEATMSYFESLLPYMHENSVMVFDDIYWRSGMTKAWQAIQKHPSVKLSIDTFDSGYLFFKSELKEKIHYHFWV